MLLRILCAFHQDIVMIENRQDELLMLADSQPQKHFELSWANALCQHQCAMKHAESAKILISPNSYRSIWNYICIFVSISILITKIFSESFKQFVVHCKFKKWQACCLFRCRACPAAEMGIVFASSPNKSVLHVQNLINNSYVLRLLLCQRLSSELISLDFFIPTMTLTIPIKCVPICMLMISVM